MRLIMAGMKGLYFIASDTSRCVCVGDESRALALWRWGSGMRNPRWKEYRGGPAKINGSARWNHAGLDSLLTSECSATECRGGKAAESVAGAGGSVPVRAAQARIGSVTPGNSVVAQGILIRRRRGFRWCRELLRRAHHFTHRPLKIFQAG